MFFNKLPKYDILMENINYCPITEAVEYDNFVYEMNLIETTLYDMVNKETSNRIKRIATGILTEASEGEEVDKSSKVKDIITKIIDFFRKMINGLIAKVTSIHTVQLAWLKLNKGKLANVVVTNDRDIDTFKNAINPKSIPIGHTTAILTKAVEKMSNPNYDLTSDSFASDVSAEMYKSIGINKDDNTVEQLMGAACKYKLSQINSKSLDMVKFIESGLKETISGFNDINTRLTAMVRVTNKMTPADAAAIKSVVDEYAKVCKDVAIGSARVGNEAFRLLKILTGEKNANPSGNKPEEPKSPDVDKPDDKGGQTPLEKLDARIAFETRDLETYKQYVKDATPENKAKLQSDVDDQEYAIGILKDRRKKLVDTSHSEGKKEPDHVTNTENLKVTELDTRIVGAKKELESCKQDMKDATTPKSKARREQDVKAQEDFIARLELAKKKMVEENK
jgi:hypothetical protein